VDLLLGNAAGTVSYYEGYRFAFTAVNTHPAGQIAFQWNSAAFVNYRLLAGPSPTSMTNVAAANVPSGGTITSWTNSAPEPRQFYRLLMVR
jgi:hypothetical protein